MLRRPRQFQHERQPLLELDETAKEINRRDKERETRTPQQLELLEGPQRELFPALEVPQN